jgi:hypothetical protein
VATTLGRIELAADGQVSIRVGIAQGNEWEETAELVLPREEARALAEDVLALLGCQIEYHGLHSVHADLHPRERDSDRRAV